MSTICALSTPNAVGGIAVIRISGENSRQLADRIFVSYSKKTVVDMAGHTCAYGKIVDKGETVDDVLLTVFIAPKSYTGEDTVEISCHGGVYVSKRILRLLISLGCEPAEAGEFTKRAFLNGKLSLTQAEGVADIISAQGEATLRSANLMRQGALYKTSRSVADRLINLLGSLSAWTDYPDEDIPETDNVSIARTLGECKTTLEKLLRDYDTGRILREGIDTAIVGKPNVGKSTLMNRLLGYERSIVTDIAGTTRDVVEESVRLGEVTLRLSDTAGIRSSSDLVEAIGVDRARAKLSEAQLVLAVFDGSRPLDDEDKELLELIKNRNTLVIINKSDLLTVFNSEYIMCENILEVSSKSGDGFEELKAKIYEMFKLDSLSDSAEIFANERQKKCCEVALESVILAKEAIEMGETLDALTIMVDRGANALLELTGEKTTEAVVDDVFTRFCVGK